MIKMFGRFPLLNLPSFGGDLKGFVGHQFPPTSEADDPWWFGTWDKRGSSAYQHRAKKNYFRVS